MTYRGEGRITATGLTGCLCVSVANPPKSQSTLSETGIPVQTSAAPFPFIPQQTNKHCCCSDGGSLILHYTACNRKQTSEMMAPIPPISFGPFCCLPCSLVLIFLHTPLKYMLHFYLGFIAAAVIQGDLMPRSMCHLAQGHLDRAHV